MSPMKMQQKTTSRGKSAMHYRRLHRLLLTQWQLTAAPVMYFEFRQHYHMQEQKERVRRKGARHRRRPFICFWHAHGHIIIVGGLSSPVHAPPTTKLFPLGAVIYRTFQKGPSLPSFTLLSGHGNRAASASQSLLQGHKGSEIFCKY